MATVLMAAFLRRSSNSTPASEARILLEEAQEYRERWHTYPPHLWFQKARKVIQKAGDALPQVITEPPGALEFPDFHSALERIASGKR